MKLFSKQVLIVAILLMGSWASAQDIVLPDKVQGFPGTFITIEAKTASTEVTWFIPSIYVRTKEGNLIVDPTIPPLSMVPTELLKSSKIALVTAPSPGEYKIYACTCVQGKIVQSNICTVISGTPNPGPGPGPGPIPPSPLSDYAKSLDSAWALDSRDVSGLDKLLAFYLVASDKTQDMSIKTVGQLYTEMKEVADKSLNSSVQNLRKAVFETIRASLGEDVSLSYSPELRASSKLAVAKIISGLKELKNASSK